jgi:hypothetical protein
MRIAYESKRFGAEVRHTIAQATSILADYAEQGFDLTLRQLYYQFVGHDLFPDDRRWTWIEATRKWVRDPEGTKNAEPNYKWLGDIVNKGRMAGYIDWDSIVDRTRELEERPHWQSPVELVEAAVQQFRVDRRADQPRYVEVWIEKDALTGVISGACERFDVPYLSCRGYSQSEMWGAAQRLLKHIRDGQDVTILHLGDHDPSGIDMTRDIEDRLALFIGSDYVRAVAKDLGVKATSFSEANLELTVREALDRLHVDRVALNMDQVEQFNPPPNPAKMTDSRFQSYLDEHGNESWELDALSPATIANLISDRLDVLYDEEPWQRALDREEDGRQILARIAQELAADDT